MEKRKERDIKAMLGVVKAAIYTIYRDKKQNSVNDSCYDYLDT